MCALPPKTRKQIAAEYGISRSTLSRKLKKIALRLPSGDLLPNAQKAIYDRLGYPVGIAPKDFEKTAPLSPLA